MSGCAGTDPDVYTGGAGHFKGSANFTRCCPGGEDIVDKRNMLAIQTLFAVKSLDEIFPAFSCAERGLLIGVTNLLQK
jgi:hypothetical protein